MRIFIVLLLSVLCACEWEKPKVLNVTDYPIYTLATYVERFNMKTHIIYLTTDGSIFYINVDSNGTESSAIQIGKTTLRSQKAFSIIGANDGQHLYVVFNVRVGYYDDIRFTESRNDGQTWSTPVSPRSNQDDSYERYIPEILVLSSGRLFVFYVKNSYSDREVYTATRPPNSLAWSTEKYVAERSNSKFISTGIIGDKAPRSTIYMEIVQDELGVRFCTTDYSGNQFTCENTLKDKDVVTRQYAALTKQDYNKTLYNAVIRKPDEEYVASIYAVKNKQEWKELHNFTFAGIGESLLMHNIRVCEIKKAAKVVYFLKEEKYTKAKNAYLKMISVEDPTKVVTLPIPYLDEIEPSSFVTIECIGDQLMAIGTDGKTKLLMEKFNFE